MMRRTGFHFRFNHRLRDKLPGIEGRAHRDLGRARRRARVRARQRVQRARREAERQGGHREREESLHVREFARATSEVARDRWPAHTQ